MTFGDPFAAILGKYFNNSRKLFGDKNIAGSFGHAFISVFVTLIYLYLSNNFLTGNIFYDSIAIYVISVVSELGFGLSLL
jgi:dolichol kinase